MTRADRLSLNLKLEVRVFLSCKKDPGSNDPTRWLDCLTGMTDRRKKRDFTVERPNGDEEGAYFLERSCDPRYLTNLTLEIRHTSNHTDN